MKILYFGTVCDLQAYDQRLANCRCKPSVASIVFESALLEGFYQNHADVEIYSFPMIPAFPKSPFLYFGKKTERLPCGYTCRWLQTINVPGLKQLSRRLDARRILKGWLAQHAEDGMIVTYSIPPFLAKDILRYSKRFHVKTAAIIPDLLRDMYIHEKKSLGAILKKLYLAPALQIQGDYDGYVFLTEAMRQVVAPEKPYIVMEGIADTSSVSAPDAHEKSASRAIMYAGMLHEKYGIIQLLDAFEAINGPDTELWLFGSGTAVPEIQERAARNPKIRYFGSVSREEILSYERKATLLVNPRDADEEFTQYSFPSKTIEYMLSGTPLVTTKLKGIPGEYFDYVFTVDKNQKKELADALLHALSLSGAQLNDFGRRAQQFIWKEKNASVQSAKVLRFLREVNKS